MPLRGGGEIYGEIFGKEAILSLSEKNIPKGEIISMYVNGEIDFNLKERFTKSLNIMREKELETNIKLADFIESKYKSKLLFLTHNHPSNYLFYELIRQLLKIVDLPIDDNALRKNKATLPKTKCPITPYDKEKHGYDFDFDKSWLADGVTLIDLILLNPRGVAMIKPRQVIYLRDAALKLEKHDLRMARSLMSLAKIGKPDGPLINLKLKEYEKKLLSL